MDLKHNFSNNIKNLRIAKNFTLEEFADEIGVGKTTLQDIENGKSNSTLDTILKIADRLGMNPLLLLTNFQTSEEYILTMIIVQSIDRFCDLSETQQIEVVGHIRSIINLIMKDRS